METPSELGFLADANFDLDHLVSDMPTQSCIDPSGVTFVPTETEIPRTTVARWSDVSSLQGASALLPHAAAIQDPAVLTRLTSELISIRDSLNQLKRNQNHTDPQATEARRTALLSDAITHLANSRASQSLIQTPAARPPVAFDLSTFSIKAEAVPPRNLVAPLEVNPPIPDFASGTDEERLHKKKMVRKERNRQAAQNSRMRKKMRMDALEESLAKVMDQNRKYQIACEELTRRNQELEQRLQEATSNPVSMEWLFASPICQKEEPMCKINSLLEPS
jgi:hypothetical protein